jgi:hypothetical protein
MHQRAQFAGPAEIARFFEQHFPTEIEEHGGRMRDLIAGREFSANTTGVQWDDEPSGSGTGDGELTRDRTRDLGTGDLSLLDDVPEPEEGAEKTRIESNPLEAVLAAEAAASGKGRRSGEGDTVDIVHGAADRPTMPAEGHLPLPAPPPTAPHRAAPSQASPHEAATKTPPPRPPVDALAQTVERPRPAEVEAAIAARDAKKRDTDKPKFLASSSAAATIVHDPDTPPPEVPGQKRPSFADVKTAMSPEMAPTALGGPVRAPTAPPGPNGPSSQPHEAAMPPMHPGSGPHGQPMMPPPPGSGPHDGQSMPHGQPMPPGMMPPPPGMMPPGSYPPGMYPPGAGPYPPPPPPYGGMPGMHPGAPPLGSMSGLPLPAHLMSPAPGGFHGGHDLAHLANQPIRRIPPWGLAALFVLAIVGALVLTIVIAKLAS